LHAVVQESIGVVRTEDETRPHGFPEMVSCGVWRGVLGPE
jgi:hypothetical protein